MMHRAKVRSRIRPSDVFLVTYPKSGTIWLSFLVANVLKSDPLEQLNLQSLLKYVPDINEAYFHRGSLVNYEAHQDPRVFSLHAPYDSAFSKVVYVVRDPRDVMVSYWHFRRLTEPEFHLSLREFIETDYHWPCRWDEHVSGWIVKHNHPNLLAVRYEDMRENTVRELSRIIEFCGLSYTERKIENAVDASGFGNMQQLEKQFGVHGVVGVRNGSFVRRGQIGGWRNELDESCLRFIESKYYSVMDRFGYKPVTR